MTKLCTLYSFLGLLVALTGCPKSPTETGTQASPSPSAQVSLARQTGWDPKVACGFLSGKLNPGEYRSGNKTVYGCFSSAKDLGAGSSSPNSIMYYAGGDAQRARQLGLVLYVNNLESSNEAHKVLLEYSRELSEQALGVPMSRGVEDAILAGAAGDGRVDTTKVEIFRKPSANGKGYELHFVITPRL
jgi:hypothetical protein